MGIFFILLKEVSIFVEGVEGSEITKALKPKKKCHKTSCRNLTREKYCLEHIHLSEEDKKIRHQYYDRNKSDQKAKAFYNSKPW
ncbi:hypothetical protein AZF04_02845 [Alkalihalobacillus trypoxylicola]|uniref:HNH endonuclease n=1 Tax=Alkalihalobacillus trypoxylicola TaxID=519424 RepID=A0A162FCI8_9BACI|nr:hypothetical protein AZF04_02845 [Alkalihalobacillus trypoxylicola]